MKEWRTVSIPSDMFEKVRKVFPKLYGYISVADYVRDAVRRKLQSDQIRLDMESAQD